MLSDQAREIADEVKSRGLWLYDPIYKKWYSPESFTHTLTYAKADDEFLNTLQIKHPKEGIEAGFKSLEDLKIKLTHFIKSVIDHYIK